MRHLADLDPVARGTRRHRIEQSMPQVGRYLSGLTSRLIDALGNLDQVHIVGVDGGFPGLLDGHVRDLSWGDVEGWAAEGGAELGTRRRIPTEDQLYALARSI